MMPQSKFDTIYSTNQKSSNVSYCPSCFQVGQSVAAIHAKETVYQKGQTQSKRAALFQEPERKESGYISWLIMFLLLAVAMICLSVLSDMLHADLIELKAAINEICFLLPIIVGLLCIIFGAGDNDQELDELAFQKKKKRYRKLKYCEQCHKIFDALGNSANADSTGFNQMLKI